MPPVIRSAQEEAALMHDLFAELDDSVWYAPPTPSPSKKKPNTTHSTRQPRTPFRKHRSQSLTRLPGILKRAGPSPSRVFSADNVDMKAMLEDMEDDWDWDSNEISPKKKPNRETFHLAGSKHVSETCVRCIVETVSENDIEGRLSKNLIVRLECGERRSVVLQDDWVTTGIKPKDIINIIGTFMPLSQSSSSITSSITISSKHNLLILHPDLLLTATAVSTAAQCRRRPLLSGMVRSSSDMSPALVWGHILHTVVQACLSDRCWNDRFLDEKIDEVVRENLLDLVRINVNVETAISEIKARAKGVQSFFDRYMSDSPKVNAILTNNRAARDEVTLLAISELLDIEEDIWSPTYGLKGKLDATVQTTITHKVAPGQLAFSKPPPVRGPKPLEVKTGRATSGMEHRAQTMLYTLLAQERYGIDVTSGLLYYTQSEEVVQVPASRNELRGLILGRNELAMYTMRRQTNSSEPFLPPTIDDERTCKRCYSLDICMLYRKAVENVEDRVSPIADAYSLKTSHLTATQAAFFKKWEHLLSLEEQDVGRYRKELWTMGAAERERHGRCFGSMVLDSSYVPASIKGPGARDKIHTHTYKLKRDPNTVSMGSFLNGFLDVNDAITVSVEPHLLALARGFILELTPTDVVIGVDHDLSLDHIHSRLAVFEPPSSSATRQIIFRIDKDEMHGGMSRIRDNLAQLLYAGGDTRKVELIVDNESPQFDESLSIDLPSSAAFHLTNLNPNQRQAVDKVLRAEDYALILGMPGTGKTTLIAAMIKALVAMDKTVLLTSYTHSAVDTILSKLKDAEFSILRLGNIDKVHPDVRQFTLDHRKRATTVEQLEYQLMSPPVVATTCLSIEEEVYARKGGLDVSLFRHLSNAHPHAVVDLTYQYRMNEDIMLLSNKLIYSDRLRCGSQAVARRSLDIPDKSFLRSLHIGHPACVESDCWLTRILSERCKAVFIDTDPVPARDSRVGDLVQNETEAKLVYQITETLIKSGVPTTEIGIISLYRQQIKLLGQHLGAHQGLEFFTADKSQGRDKECIVVSLVRSNDSSQVGELMKDWRRINVSFTRAKSKLIIIGSRKTLQGAPLLKEFFSLMDSQDWILTLPHGADAVHADAFDNVVTVSTPTAATSGNKHNSLKRRTNVVDDVENGVLMETNRKIRRIGGEDGLLKGRPILQDLINGMR
ncbi:Dna2-domain-containing protein [Lentinula raphanica]|uniref:DNA replication ATP-dependent helicase/nuclease DNA2 n=1 Tax=Lentinula raphanica TaxID=153919 RepID=A0AA38PLU5_9AGAR|nr:Dna2-domain-containing protein [Lentinula raphanica]KAJ3845333.1 Dna2-domain-containing protein [Lentinula raphanica]